MCNGAYDHYSYMETRLYNRRFISKKLVEIMMKEFSLIVSSITAGKLKHGRVVAK